MASDGIINRRIVLRQDQKVRKSVRIRFSNLSNLDSEKKHREILKGNKTVSVPQPYKHRRSEEFKHFIMEKITGTTRACAWPTLPPAERTFIAGQVVEFTSGFPNTAANRVCPVVHTYLVDRADQGGERGRMGTRTVE